MRNRLFEKTIRRKKVPPEILIWIIFFCVFILCVAENISTDLDIYNRVMLAEQGIKELTDVSWVHLDRSKVNSRIMLLFSISIWIYPTINLLRRCFPLNVPKTKDVVFVDQAHTSFSVTAPIFNSSSFLYLFLEEPYIYRVELLTDSFSGKPYRDTREQLHFNLPIHWSYKSNPNYEALHTQYMNDERKTETEKKSLRFSNFKYQRNKNGRDWHKYTYYITYEKAQALNKVFDMVGFPAFTVRVDEYQKRLISIHPIEGREYPSEVPELLEKINQMYP